MSSCISPSDEGTRVTAKVPDREYLRPVDPEVTAYDEPDNHWRRRSFTAVDTAWLNSLGIAGPDRGDESTVQDTELCSWFTATLGDEAACTDPQLTLA